MDTVLVVDDSVMLLNYLQESFETYKDEFALITANDGLEAIEIIPVGSVISFGRDRPYLPLVIEGVIVADKRVTAPLLNLQLDILPAASFVALACLDAVPQIDADNKGNAAGDKYDA